MLIPPIVIIAEWINDATAISGVGACFNWDQLIVDIVSLAGPAMNIATIDSLIEMTNSATPDIAIEGFISGIVISNID